MTVVARKLGLIQAIGLSISLSASTAAIALNVSLTAQAAGGAAPLAFAIGTAEMAIVGLSFVAFSGRIAHAGSAYAYVSHTFGRRWGFIAGWTLLLTYLTFTGPGGEHFTVATSLIGSRTFPSYLRAMRRADLAEDPRFATAAARRANLEELHRIVQCWILTFRDIGALDAQLDEAKIALGEVRSLKQLSEMEWAEYWGAIQEVSDRNGGTYRLPGRPWHFSHEKLEPLGSPAFQGEHNRAVFSELGLSEDEIDGYVAAGALVSVPIPATASDYGRRANGTANIKQPPLPTIPS